MKATPRAAIGALLVLLVALILFMAPILAGIAALALVSVWEAHTLRRRLARERGRPSAVASTNARGNDCWTGRP